MNDYEVVYEEGDYLWDIDNEVLIKYDCNSLGIIGVNTMVVYPIILNEDVLHAIGFDRKGLATYSYKSTNIYIDGTSSNGILKIDGIAITYVSDIQHYFRSKKEVFIIDEEKLKNACLKTYEAKKF
ncbi:MAG: hypothetical protein ACI30X_01345 [Muribaculaceae bacterium]